MTEAKMTKGEASGIHRFDYAKRAADPRLPVSGTDLDGLAGRLSVALDRVAEVLWISRWEEAAFVGPELKVALQENGNHCLIARVPRQLEPSFAASLRAPRPELGRFVVTRTGTVRGGGAVPSELALRLDELIPALRALLEEVKAAEIQAEVGEMDLAGGLRISVRSSPMGFECMALGRYACNMAPRAEGEVGPAVSPTKATSQVRVRGGGVS